MGISVYGYLRYGICYDRSEVSDQLQTRADEEDSDLLEAMLNEIIKHEEKLRVGHGLCKPEVVDYRSVEWVDYRDRKNAWERKFSVNAETVGYCDNNEFLLFAEGSEKSAYWGAAVAIKPEELIVTAEWEERLLAVTKLLELPWKDPSWYLTSYFSH